MKAGDLRHRIVIQRLDTFNTLGEVTDNWTTYVTVWANVAPLKGREYFDSAMQEAEVDSRITMRYLPGIKPQMRVVYGNQTYDVKSVINVGMKDRELQLMVQEIVI
jgi:SPP1 family predicted phage head-tail adaptor